MNGRIISLVIADLVCIRLAVIAGICQSWTARLPPPLQCLLPSKRIQWPYGKEVVFRFLHMRSAELALGLNQPCQMTLHTFVLTVVASFVTNSSTEALWADFLLVRSHYFVYVMGSKYRFFNIVLRHSRNISKRSEFHNKFLPYMAVHWSHVTIKSIIKIQSLNWASLQNLERIRKEITIIGQKEY